MPAVVAVHEYARAVNVHDDVDSHNRPRRVKPLMCAPNTLALRSEALLQEMTKEKFNEGLAARVLVVPGVICVIGHDL